MLEFDPRAGRIPLRLKIDTFAVMDDRPSDSLEAMGHRTILQSAGFQKNQSTVLHWYSTYPRVR